MKQKKQNRILAALLAVAMMFQMLPMLAFAAEDTPLAKGQAKIGKTVCCPLGNGERADSGSELG